MGKAGYNFQWLMIDTTDPEITHFYVLLEALGDCPIGVQGWHYKTFPARVPSIEIITNHLHEAVLWPQVSPPWVWRGKPGGEGAPPAFGPSSMSA